MLVTPEWVIAHHRDPNMRVIDPRRAEDHAKGHVPGAVGAATAYKDPVRPLHVMTPAQAEVAIAGLGISNDTTVVISAVTMLAGRAWWFLTYHGHRDVHILDGGFDAYVAAGGPVSTDPVTVAPGVFHATIDPTLIARAEDIQRELGTATKILDVRSDAEWKGSNTMDHKRVGHVPGARHLLWELLLEPDAPHRFKTPEQIRAVAAERGVTERDRVITVCEVGWRASHTAFALRLAGFKDVRVYDASMREWDNREELPLEPPAS